MPSLTHLLNPSLDFRVLRESFQSSRLVLIRDFLDKDFAEKVHSGIYDLTERDLWYESKFGIFDQDSISYQFDKFPLCGFNLVTMLETDSNRKHLPESREIWIHPEQELPGDHSLRTLADLWMSPIIKNVISGLTGHALNLSRVVAFASRYRKNSFCSVHTDGTDPARKVGFVFNLTKNWKVHYGGNFVLVDDKHKEITHSVSPIFNSLLVFDVPVPHAVMPVSKYCKNFRHAFSGWFYQD